VTLVPPSSAAVSAGRSVTSLAASRRRAAAVRWNSYPSVSTTSVWSGQYEEHSRRERSSRTDRNVRRIDRTGEDPPELRVAALARAGDHLRCQRRRRDVRDDLGVFEGLGQCTEGEHCGEIEQRPNRRGDRDLAMDRDVGRREPLAMHDDPVTSTMPRRRRHDHVGDRRPAASAKRPRDVAVLALRNATNVTSCSHAEHEVTIVVF
jgi:hypothetical protein